MSLLPCYLLLTLFAILHTTLSIEGEPVDNTYKLSPSEKLAARKAIVGKKSLRNLMLER